MNTQPKTPGAELPEHLTAQIRAFEARLRKFETLYTVCGALAGLALAFGLLFVSDRLWDTPMLLRVAFTAGGMVAAGWFTLYWMRRWGWSHRTRRELAVLIQKRHRKLGDRLQGVVELAASSGDFSRRWCAPPSGRWATGGALHDFTQAVETRRPAWLAAAAAFQPCSSACPSCCSPRRG
ncbi:MAG: hypothetical protein U1F87_19110 [Kiritimatiellia bacterium]